MFLMKLLAWIALIASVIWFCVDVSFEPGIAAVVAGITLIGLFVKEKRPVRRTIDQSQRVSGSSIGIQAGGNVQIGSSGKKDDE